MMNTLMISIRMTTSILPCLIRAKERQRCVVELCCRRRWHLCKSGHRYHSTTGRSLYQRKLYLLEISDAVFLKLTPDYEMWLYLTKDESQTQPLLRFRKLKSTTIVIRIRERLEGKINLSAPYGSTVFSAPPDTPHIHIEPFTSDSLFCQILRYECQSSRSTHQWSDASQNLFRAVRMICLSMMSCLSGRDPIEN